MTLPENSITEMDDEKIIIYIKRWGSKKLKIEKLNIQTILNIIFIICGFLGVLAYFEIQKLTELVEKIINRLKRK